MRALTKLPFVLVFSTIVVTCLCRYGSSTNTTNLVQSQFDVGRGNSLKPKQMAKARIDNSTSSSVALHQKALTTPDTDATSNTTDAKTNRALRLPTMDNTFYYIVGIIQSLMTTAVYQLQTFIQMMAVAGIMYAMMSYRNRSGSTGDASTNRVLQTDTFNNPQPQLQQQQLQQPANRFPNGNNFNNPNRFRNNFNNRNRPNNNNFPLNNNNNNNRFNANRNRGGR